MISLVMLSGGFDSAYVLARLLRETDDEVIAHHIHQINDSRRYLPEKEASEKIVKYCYDKYRPFAYTQSAIDRRGFSAHGLDILAAGFEAGIVSASYFLATKNNVDRWFFGLASDDDLPRWKAKAAQDCCEYNCDNGAAPGLYLFRPISLEEQIQYMSLELAELTWSCRRPRGKPGSWVTCNSCEACTRRNHAISNVSPSTKLTELEVPAVHWQLILRRKNQRE